MKTITVTFPEDADSELIVSMWKALRHAAQFAVDIASPELREAIRQSTWIIDVTPGMSLVDDLADVLASTVVGWESIIGHDLAQAPEVQRVMARYVASLDQK